MASSSANSISQADRCLGNFKALLKKDQDLLDLLPADTVVFNPQTMSSTAANEQIYVGVFQLNVGNLRLYARLASPLVGTSSMHLFYEGRYTPVANSEALIWVTVAPGFKEGWKYEQIRAAATYYFLVRKPDFIKDDINIYTYSRMNAIKSVCDDFKADSEAQQPEQ
ncbi:hypothetical protein EJ04DRAFT_567126 [Polyplosphaeria fusca]|uniref:Uncharacterized protein n=1 Tax=Polyplosphaeria fusca TaxID=682080 RepID=A0A9P4QR40_9PLEO|nr:hypothetical protein EJ04DRAFT_567126 [Polyplosphaeria fusca]